MEVEEVSPAGEVRVPSWWEQLRQATKSQALLTLERENARLREENRHLLNVLLKREGVLGIGEQPQPIPTQKKPSWQVAREQEARAWNDYEQMMGGGSDIAQQVAQERASLERS